MSSLRESSPSPPHKLSVHAPLPAALRAPVIQHLIIIQLRAPLWWHAIPWRLKDVLFPSGSARPCGQRAPELLDHTLFESTGPFTGSKHHERYTHGTYPESQRFMRTGLPRRRLTCLTVLYSATARLRSSCVCSSLSLVVSPSTSSSSTVDNVRSD